MKKTVLVLSIFLSLILSSLLVIGCQDEDFGYTKEEIFRGAYERNFVKAFGAIDPNETWDFSIWGMHNRPQSTGETRAEGDEWYYVEKNTIDWIRAKFPENTSNTGISFGMLVGQETFEIIPIYQSASNTVDWELHMVLVNEDYYIDKALWRKSERIQKPESTTATCPTCEGHLMIEPKTGNDPCVICGGNGITPVTQETAGAVGCTNCSHTGKIENAAQCTTCMGTGIGKECTVCGGKGYTDSGKNPKYNNCTACGGVSILDSKAKCQNINQLKKYNASNGTKLGTGDGPCSKCGGDGLISNDCDHCSGLGYLLDCDACGGDGLGTQCTTCHVTGQSTSSSWTNITSSSDTQDATAIRSQKLTINTTSYFDGVSPVGGIIFFYLKINDTNTQSSLNKKMIFVDCPRPTNIGDGEIKVIGCEEGDNTNEDFNDLMFIIKGAPLPVILESADLGSTFETMVAKRYLIEDLGSTNDWDFNDIVVDVTQQIKKTLTDATSGKKKLVDDAKTTARLKYLCGTLPIRVKVGSDAQTEIITDPTKQEQTIDQLDNVQTSSQSTYTEGSVTGWNPDFIISRNVTGWNPAINLVTVNVWPDKIVSGSSTDNSWSSTFPQPGCIPYIIATDLTSTPNWPSEGGDIRRQSWWKGNNTNYYTGK